MCLRDSLRSTLPRVALFLLAITAIRCGGRSDLLDLPASIHVDPGPCNMAIIYQWETETPLVDTVASAELSDGETPSIFVDCQGSAGDTLHDLSGRYEPGRDAMQATWRPYGSSGAVAVTCKVTAQVNGAVTTPGERYSAGEPFSMTFDCALFTIYLYDIHLKGTLSAPLTAK